MLHDHQLRDDEEAAQEIDAGNPHEEDAQPRPAVVSRPQQRADAEPAEHDRNPDGHHAPGPASLRAPARSAARGP